MNTLFLKLSCPLALIGGAQLPAATLGMIPTPIEQGGMIHTMVTFSDQPNDTFTVMPPPSAPELKPLAQWAPGDTFEPADPWFNALDPSQDGLAFGSRTGILIDAGASDPLPAGKSLGIRVTSIDTGLTGYFASTAGDGTFNPVLTQPGDAVLWSGNMWHPVFTATGPGEFSIMLEFFIADESFDGFVSPTMATSDPGYSLGNVSLEMTAVPEPTIGALMAGLLSLAFVGLRRRK